MNKYAKEGWILDKLAMSDMATVHTMVFIKKDEQNNAMDLPTDTKLDNYPNIIKCPTCSNLMNKLNKCKELVLIQILKSLKSC
jgi:hypothetical protein